MVASTEEVAVQNYYYCPQKDGKRKFVGEHGLSTLEAIALPTLNQIRAHNFTLTPDDRLTFAGYVATSHMRVPTFERQMNSLYALMEAKTIEHIASNPVALESVARSISKRDGKMISGEQLRVKLVGGSAIVGQGHRGWSIRRMFERT